MEHSDYDEVSVLRVSPPWEEPLVPRSLLVCAFFASFAAPNLIFSGEYFFSTLHLMKWAVAMVPLTLLGLWTGFRVLRRGTAATGFRLDGFAVVWLALLLYMTVQPLWAGVRSVETLYQEWFFFAFLWMVYVLCTLTMDGRVLRALLWGGLANAAINVVFAELQIRGLNEPFSFILPTPGHYIGNTGQQNMFALWMAMNSVGGIFLLIREQRKLLKGACAALLAVVFWGLLESTSRSGLLSFATGFAVLSGFFLRIEGRKRLAGVLCAVALFGAVTGLNLTFSDRARILGAKMDDMMEQPLSFAKRDSIWATSWTMFTQHPVRGVGLGQFKWNYLHAQREMLARWPHLKWQYTHWAHNEFLQWFAEGGIVGGVLMLFLWCWWLWSAWGAFRRRKQLSPEAFWGNAIVALFGFNALWTRPFHRIENVLWLTLAFALANREQLRPLFPSPPPERFEKGGRLLAGTICLVSLLGLAYFGNGVWGDRMLRLSTQIEGNFLAPETQTAYTGYLQRAFASPMVRDLAERELAYFTVRLGQATKDSERVAQGLGDLVAYFEKQPHVKELHYLLDWSKRLRNEEFREYFESFRYVPESGDAASSAVISSAETGPKDEE